MAKPTLDEMAEACQQQADSLRYHLTHRYNPYHPGKPNLAWEHEVEVWEAAALTLRVAGTDEDGFRKFIAQGLKRSRS